MTRSLTLDLRLNAMRVVVAGATFALASACGTSSTATKTDAPVAAKPMPMPPKPEEKPKVVEAPKPVEPPKKVEPKVEEPVNKDGIDDDNWLPTGGSARDTFLAAVDTARTDPAAAVPRFVDAANKAKYFYAAWFNAGAAAEASGDVAMAEKYYRQSLQVRPDYGPALSNLATLLERTGRSAEAQRIIDDTVRKMPEKAGPHLAAATLAWVHRDQATTSTEALNAIKYDERSVPAMLLMAKVFHAQGRLDTARFALENALQVEPGNALLHLELGQVQLEQGDDKAALVSFEKAARLRPTLVEAQDNYGVLLLKQGLAQESVKAFEAAARLDPKSARAQLHLGNGYRSLKQYPQAEDAYKKALTLDPNLGEAHFNLGVLYIDNPLPGIDEIARLQKGLAELKQYKASSKPDGPTLARLDDYIDATDKRITKEIKRREREERRKKEDAADAAKGAKDGGAKAGTPPAGDGKAGNPADDKAVKDKGGGAGAKPK